MYDWIVKIRPADFGQMGFNLLIYRRTANNAVEILRGDGVIETIQSGAAASKPTMYLADEMLRPLMDALIEMDIKPTDAGKTAGLLEAQTAHLDDLRHLLNLPKIQIQISGKAQ